MKPNYFLCMMALLLSFFIAYFVYNIASGEPNDIICGVVSLVCFTATLIPTVGFKYNSRRLGVNLRVLSSIVFIVMLVINVIYASTRIVVPNYMIINGVILILYIISLYRLSKIKEV